MIALITGAVGSGKSTRLAAMHRETGGSGWWLPAAFAGGERIGQDIVNLRTGEREPFTRRLFARPALWSEAARLGGMSFSRAGLLFLREAMEAALREEGPLFIDEIGPLELMGGGCHSALVRLGPAPGRPVAACVRASCVGEAARAYGWRDCRLIGP